MSGVSWEQTQHAHTPADSFYAVPASFSQSSKPGTLLRVEQHTELANYTVPSSLTMSRILYTSLDLNGTVVPTSAYALWPYTAFDTSPKGKTGTGSSQPQFPLVAWAHGTSGFFAPCGPSNYRALQYHFMVPFQLALEGFAVVAPDYAGLGSAVLSNGKTIKHNYLANPAGANDLAYAIEALRQAFPQRLAPDGPVVAMGHSQGGGVVWSFAERQAVSPIAGYRGTVTLSPPTTIIDKIKDAAQIAASAPSNATASLPTWVTTVLGLQPKIVAGITAVYPKYNLSGLTPLSYDRWTNVVAPLQGCLPTEALVFSDVPVDQLAKARWYDDPVVQEWANRSAFGDKKFAGPMLVLVGGEDVFLPVTIERAVDAACALGPNKDQDLEMVTASAMEHFPNIQASRTKWMGWIKEKVREDGGNDGAVCGRNTVLEGFDTDFTIRGQVSPNWLVEGASVQEGWKLAL